jgi:hypothetical protein
MGRLDKMKRQAILEANQRNLGIIVEQSTVDNRQKEVSEENDELKREIEFMTKKLESLVNNKNISTAQLKNTLKDFKTKRKLIKNFKSLEKEIIRTESEIERVESMDPHKIDKVREGAGKILKGLAAGFITTIIAGIAAKFGPDHVKHIKAVVGELKNKLK